MRKIFIAAVVSCFLVALNVHAQEQATPVSRSFQLRLPQTVDMTNLSILYCLRGSFGGYCDFVRTKTGVREYEIDPSYQGQPAKSLQVIIYSPGYQVETLDFPSLAAVEQRSVELQLKPLSTVPFFGRVMLPAHLRSDGIRVAVTHTPFWECEFFDLMDCLVASFEITSVEISEDGRFRVELPDFAQDPIVSSLGNRGEFTFWIVDRKSGEILFGLKPQGKSDRAGRIPIANWYYDEQVFI